MGKTSGKIKCPNCGADISLSASQTQKELCLPFFVVLFILIVMSNFNSCILANDGLVFQEFD